MPAGEDVGRLRHEVDPAEHHELGLGLVGGDTGESERVPAGVGPPHDFVTLVVVAEDDQTGPEGRLGRSDPFDQLIWFRRRVPVGERCL